MAGRGALTGAEAGLAAMLAACTPASQPMGPATVAPTLTETALIATDGYRLPVRVTVPDARAVDEHAPVETVETAETPADVPARGEPAAVILALHGFDDYSASFEDAAAAWAEAGIVTVAMDQRGFGETENIGIWAGTDTYVADAVTAVEAVARTYPGRPLVLLGESMGSAVALLALARRPDLPVDALILVAPAVWDWEAMPFWEELPFEAAVALFPGMIVSGEGLDLEPTDNALVQREMAYDPLVLKENRLDTVAGLLDLMAAALPAAATLDRPTLIQLGENESIVPEAHVRALFDGLATAPHPPVIAVYPDGYHMLLRDLAADEPIGDIPAFITDPDAPLPSGADRIPLPWAAGG